MGVTVENPRVHDIRARNEEEWLDYPKSMDFNHGLKIVMIILDKASKNYYSKIKQFIYSDIGLPVQVVLKENSSKNLSYFPNLLNQMVVKIGGILYKIQLLDKLPNTLNDEIIDIMLNIYFPRRDYDSFIQYINCDCGSKPIVVTTHSRILDELNSTKSTDEMKSE